MTDILDDVEKRKICFNADLIMFAMQYGRVGIREFKDFLRQSETTIDSAYAWLDNYVLRNPKDTTEKGLDTGEIEY